MPKTKLQNRAQVVFFLILLLLLSVGVVRVIAPLWTVILLAYLFALAFWPLYKKLNRKKPRWRTGLKVGLITALFLTVVLIPIIFFGHIILQQLAELAGLIINDQKMESFIASINETLKGYDININITLQSVNQLIFENLGSIVGWFINSIGGIIGVSIKVLTWSMLFVLFFASFLPNLDKLKVYWIRLSPLDKETSSFYLKQVKIILHNVVFVTAVIAFIQGVMVGVIFWILGLPFPGLFGLLIFFLGFIPFFGTSIVLIPVSIILALLGQWTEAIVVLLAQLTIVSNIDLVIRPMMTTKELSVHPTVIVTGVIGGVMIFGLVGLVIGPVLVILLSTSINIFIDNYSKPEKESSKET